MSFSSSSSSLRRWFRLPTIYSLYHQQQQHHYPSYAVDALIQKRSFHRMTNPVTTTLLMSAMRKETLETSTDKSHQRHRSHYRHPFLIQMALFSSSSSTTSEDVQVFDISDKAIERLPRIYVGPTPSNTPILESITRTMMTDNNNNNNNKSNNRLVPNAIVTLTDDQSHYLRVMRITSSKRWGPTYAGCVRIFNGLDGEWLARLLVMDEEGVDDDNRSRRQQRQQRSRKSRRRNNTSGSSGNGNSSTDGAVLECIQQIQQQQDSSTIAQSTPASSYSSISVQLYIGRLKKQRLRWVVEKATEIGVDGITLIDTEYTTSSSSSPSSSTSNSHSNGKHVDSFEYDKHVIQIIEASEQCERLSVPCLSTDSVSLVDVISFLSDSVEQRQNRNDEKSETHDSDDDERHLWLICKERSLDSLPILSALHQAIEDLSRDQDEEESSNHPQPKKQQHQNHHHHHLHVHILVGPEGGWSPNEMDMFSNLVSLASPSMTTTAASTTADISTDQSWMSNNNNSIRIQFVSLGSFVLRAETAAIVAISAAKMI